MRSGLTPLDDEEGVVKRGRFATGLRSASLRHDLPESSSAHAELYLTDCISPTSGRGEFGEFERLAVPFPKL
jgi:hypothetical protein